MLFVHRHSLSKFGQFVFASMIAASTITIAIADSDASGDSDSPNVILVESVKTTGPSSFVNNYGLTRNDLAAITATIPTVQHAIPTREVVVDARCHERLTTSRLVGCTEALPRIFELNVARGRFLAADDVKRLDNVAVLGSTVAQRLFPDGDVIGESVRIDDNYFLVVGELAPVNRSTVPEKITTATDKDIYIPLTTMRSRLGDASLRTIAGAFEAERYELSQIWMTLIDPKTIHHTKSAISDLLQDTHEKNDYAVHMIAQNPRTLPAARAVGDQRKTASTILEMGQVESEQAMEIRSPLQSTILTLVPEGTLVQKGDLLVSLDSSAIEDHLSRQKVVVANNEAELAQTQSALAGLKLQTAGASEIAELRTKVAKLQLQQTTAQGGEIDVKIKEAESEIKIADQKNQLANRRIKAFANGTIRQAELAEATLFAEEATEAKRIAAARLHWLKEHAQPTQTAVLELEVKEAEFALTTAKQEAKGQILEAEADLQARRLALESERRKLEQLQEQLANCSIRSPQVGVVQYATTQQRSRANAIEEGAEVRPLQTILRVVDMKQLQLRVHVHESRIAQVKSGCPVKIRFDAFPGREVRGTVLKVNATPEPASWIRANVKQYAVIVKLESPPAGLRLGMTAVAEISAK